MAAKLTKPSWRNVTRTTAYIEYEASDYSLPNNNISTWKGSAPSFGSTWTQTRTVTTYKNIEYEWSFGSTKASGTYEFNISAGQAKSISASLKVNCTKTETEQSRINTREQIESTLESSTSEQDGYVSATPSKQDDWQGWSDASNISSSTSTYTIADVFTNEITVYGQPSQFSWGDGVASGNIIQVSAGLSASKWNTLVERIEQWTNWKNQSDGADYSDAEVSSGELVTAAKYNILARALGVSTVTAHTKNTTGTLITASVFIALQTAVNS